MNLIRNSYNNELIGAIALVSILHVNKEITLAKALLIFPFYSHSNTRKILMSKKSQIRSLEELIVKYPSYFSNYNERFQSLVPITINSIILLKRMGLVNLNGEIISLNENKKIDLNNRSLGNRVEEIVKSSEKLAKILKEDTNNLYLQLRVEL